jgi:hypothetical protein
MPLKKAHKTGFKLTASWAATNDNKEDLTIYLEHKNGRLNK